MRSSVLSKPEDSMFRIKSSLITMGVIIALLTGCMTVSSVPEKRPESAETVKSILYAQLREWRGVPYRIGGLSKEGIDCSGLVYLVYRNRFGVELPRTTRGQLRSGKKISPKHLRAGDLVFFKTGWFDRHVGIYVEKHRFLHVSTKKGVTLSSLEDPFWKKTYWQALRVSR